MGRHAVNELAEELLGLRAEDCRNPFPYDGSRKLLREDSERYENLIAHLDLYFYDIASHCGGVKKILKWPNERLLESRKKLEVFLFEKHPKYEPLEPLITESNTPDLYARLAIYETMRTKLFRIISQLLTEYR